MGRGWGEGGEGGHGYIFRRENTPHEKVVLHDHGDDAEDEQLRGSNQGEAKTNEEVSF